MVPAHPGSTNSVVIRGLDPRIHLLKRISRSGWIADAVQVTPAVVPANAGTHNPGSLLWQKVSHSSASSMGRGVWVPAFAGTTVGVCRHSLEFSPHVLREVWPARSPSAIRGRRECRAPDAPAAAR